MRIPLLANSHGAFTMLELSGESLHRRRRGHRWPTAPGLLTSLGWQFGTQTTHSRRSSDTSPGSFGAAPLQGLRTTPQRVR
jgi:hypothetical protein